MVKRKTTSLRHPNLTSTFAKRLQARSVTTSSAAAMLVILLHCGCQLPLIQHFAKPIAPAIPLSETVGLEHPTGYSISLTDADHADGGATMEMSASHADRSWPVLVSKSSLPSPMLPVVEHGSVALESTQPESAGSVEFDCHQSPSFKANCFRLQASIGVPWYCCQHLKTSIIQDHRNFYSGNNLSRMAVGFGTGAIIANTDGDESFQNWYQDSVRSGGTDDFAAFAKQFGEGKYVFPTFGIAFLLGAITVDTAPGSKFEEWGERGLRATLVGGPALLFAQVATGASRPGETPHASRWNPFEDNNGVSGHAFVGALPFLTAAKMTDDGWCKAGMYFCSTWTAWSRVNDDAHYLSQVGLGWMMAYMACKAVDDTEATFLNVELRPILIENDIGVGMMFRY